MTIQIDSREKSKAIQKIIAYFDSNGINHYSSKLFVGDYMNLDNPRVIIDRKQNLSELCGNVCQEHKRFIREIERANNNGIKLVFLCEHGGCISTLDDVRSWKNPRLKVSPLAVSGERLHRILLSISKKYKITFLFCRKSETGEKICNILSGTNEGAEL